VRVNLFNGSVSAYTAGSVPVLPGIHQVRRYSTRDQVYRPIESAGRRAWWDRRRRKSLH